MLSRLKGVFEVLALTVVLYLWMYVYLTIKMFFVNHLL